MDSVIDTEHDILQYYRYGRDPDCRTAPHVATQRCNARGAALLASKLKSAATEDQEVDDTTPGGLSVSDDSR